MHRAEPDTLERIRRGRLGAFFRPRQLAAIGVSPSALGHLVIQGSVERIARGLYRLKGTEPTEHYSLAAACARVPRSVICLLSALQVHGIGTQLPREVWLAIPHKARAPRLRNVKLRLVRFTGPAWRYGVVATSFEGVPGHITNPARTIVDCFRFERLVGREAAMEALRDALRRRLVTVDAISRVLSVLPSRKLDAALQVLLA